MKSVSQPTIMNITRFDDYAHLEYTENEIEYESTIYVGTTVSEISKLHMNQFYFSIPQPSVKDLQLHYVTTDNFILNFTGGNVSVEHSELSNLDKNFKTNK